MNKFSSVIMNVVCAHCDLGNKQAVKDKKDPGRNNWE